LGVLNLKIQNTTLLLKYIHKFYGREDIPWANLIWTTHYYGGRVPHGSPETCSFWWKDVFRLVDYFRGHVVPWARDGRTILLLHDVWNNISPRFTFPCLFSFARKKDCSIQEFLANMDLEHNFHTPLSPHAAQEYHVFHELVSNLQNSRVDKDKWTYPWSNSAFSSSKFYSLTFQSIQPMLPLTGFDSLRLGINSRFLYGWSSKIELTQRTSSEERVFWHLTATWTALCVICIVRRRLIIFCFDVLSV
jgi:hypothetical protein